MLRSAAPPTLAVGGAVAAGSAVLSGGRGALGAAAGCAVVIGFFGVDFAGSRWSGRLPDAPVMFAVLGYVIKVIGLGVLLVAVGDRAPVGRIPFAVAVFVCTAVWLTGHVRAFSRQTRSPTA